MEAPKQKQTHGYERIELWQPVIKNESGKGYVAVLSDDSIDREDEIVGRQALEKLMEEDGYVAALMDHENKVLSQIGEWTNKRVEKIGDHYALVSEPKFYESNPNAATIRGMLDEGARLGVSIGAIPKAHENVRIDGKEVRRYTEIELLEASFVAIPANQHAHAMAVAKSLGSAEKSMTETQDTNESVESLQKEFAEFKEKQASLEKQSAEMKAEVEKKISELSEAQKNLETKESRIEELEKELSARETEVEDLQKQVEASADNEDNKKDKAYHKGMAGQTMDEEDSSENVSKAIESGKVPVFHR